MAYASRSGRASTSTRTPRAFAVCDRCGIWYNHDQLSWQFDWAGASLINKRILVCRPCTDVPQNQLRSIVLPADPVPIKNPRVELYVADETGYTTTTQPSITSPTTGIPIPQGVPVVTQDGKYVSPQPIGIPTGLDADAVMPLYQNVTYGALLPVLSVIANGTTAITVTCSSAHNLVTNSQISVEGLSNTSANGFYSVTVTTATAFTYEVSQIITSGSLQQVSTRIITAIVGLPYDFTQIPQTGA